MKRLDGQFNDFPLITLKFNVIESAIKSSYANYFTNLLAMISSAACVPSCYIHVASVSLPQ